MTMRILLLLLCLPSIVEAKTLYVDVATGNDATTYANNDINNKWATIGRAAWGNASRATPSSAEAATAGDLVLITPGTYSGVGTNSRFDMLYNSINTGTAGNPLTYRCATAGGCALTYSSGTGAMIGACGTGGGCSFGDVDYIIWDGFAIDEATALSASDTGPVVFVSTTGSSLLNSTLDGNGNPGFGDNHPGVRIEGSTSIRVANNTIHDFLTSVVNPSNANGVQVYNSYSVTIEHNTIYGCGVGIDLKSYTGGALSGVTTVRYNYIYDTTRGGMRLHRFASGSYTFLIYQNILLNTGEDGGVLLWGFDASDYPRNITLANNTIYSATHASANGGVRFLGAPGASAGIVWANNIVAASDAGLYSEANPITDVDDPVLFSAEHNVYHSNANVGRFNGTNYTLATWKSTSGQDSVAPAASEADPLFVNAAAYNFHLQNGGQAALTLGRVVASIGGTNGDTIPVGAYITGNETIGVESAEGATVATPAISGGMSFQGGVNLQ